MGEGTKRAKVGGVGKVGGKVGSSIEAANRKTEKQGGRGKQFRV